MIQTGYLSACKSAARYVFLTLLSLAFLQSLHAQNPLAPSAMQQKAREEIQRRGLDEAVVRGRLLDRGINIDSITPEQLPYLQDSIQQVIDELEAEKSKPAKTPAVKQKVSPPGNAGNAPGKRTGELQQKPPSAARKEEALAGEQQFYDSLSPAQVWGQHLFRDKSLAVFRTSDETTAPDHYILSTGDVLTISVFGPSQFDAQFEISREGYIQPEELPKIFLKGLRLAQAKELLRSRFSQFYRFAPEQFAVTLTSPRNITVNIFGETFHYGSFSLSALNTAFNALVAAGGPNDLGTVRNIKVIRGKETKRLDVYAFMNNPAIQYDFFLENNDIIHVPVAERIVGIRGAIRRPFRYELTGNENLVGLLEFAGGLNADAYRELIQVRRYTDDKQVLIDVNLKELLSKKQDFPLLNGDEVLVRVIPNPIENTVIIEGSVEYPGQYAFDDTKKVSDLVKKGALRPEARTDIAFLLRTNNDKTTRLIQLDVGRLLATPGAGQDLPLQPGDRLTIYAQGRYT
ncbi:MAG: polysaccharide biosynthesis/export family protein, partial [Saprospiraceae bacterium]|nr:polysaccharide biosynthesis/export family protein [Saprospiraceae bacterium]